MDSEANHAPESTLPSTPKDKDPFWKHPLFPVSISVLSVILTAISGFNTYRSASAATKSAAAAQISAQAALTNADWASYQKTPHHDLIARVLRGSVIIAGWSAENTNGFGYVDVAIINNGNQQEILRRMTFYYAEIQETNAFTYDVRTMNTQIPKGDKLALHLLLSRSAISSGKPSFITLGITAMGPDAEDLETKIFIGRFALAADGQGGNVSVESTKPIQIISDQRQDHQKQVPLGDMF